ncbi:glycogen/starch synthase [Ferrimonas sp. YFM]|uniref:glycogen synthase n=1 Tax=Ferrimonas sp. YFM TaxID=3028878 RepID=UPI0025728914|nr:glycogen/starch synthase [Ferrimonas sp. YFM]BDY05898.1 glycogen synthase [Ferrimonas sp. YFM]
MKTEIRVLMAAAENGALTGGKVGGMGDVIRDLPSALASQGVRADLIMPGYGRFATQQQAEELARIQVAYGTQKETLVLYRCANPVSAESSLYLLEHPLFAAAGAGAIYDSSHQGEPYALDAAKFALFCLGVAEALHQNLLETYHCLHLHDWHTALLALLRTHHPRYASLKQVRCVYSIHNLAHQGIRPLGGSSSSLAHWFPGLSLELGSRVLGPLVDPRYPGCINPMRCAINLADKIHLVSPGYAKEVLRPNQPQLGFRGGEGLEADLRRRHEQGDLVGIINGIEYPQPASALGEFHRLMQLASDSLIRWQAKKQWVAAQDYIASQRMRMWPAQQEPELLLTSVCRLTDQKVALLLHTSDNGCTVLETLLEELATHCPTGLYLMLGNGNGDIEAQLQQIAARHPNFWFLNGYHEPLSNALYRRGDLFLMPSSFEPCGLSQLLAMREGQPVLAHAVGGLSDTIEDNRTGLLFRGDGPDAQGEALLNRFREFLALTRAERRALSDAARAARFDWQAPAALYRQHLYC